MKNFNRFSLWVILASATLTIMGGAVIAPVLNLIRDGLGVDAVSVGFIVTIHALFFALSSPLIGNLVDRVGARKPLMFGLLLYGVAGGSGVFITSYWVLILSRAVLGIAIAAIFVSITVTLFSLYKGDERNKIMGWRGTANSFGGVIWPLIGGVLGGFSWHLPFAVYFLGLPVGFLALIAIPEVHQGKTDDAGEKGSVLRVFKNHPILFVIYGLRFWAMVLLYNIIVFLPPLLEKIGISSPSYIALFVAAVALAAGSTSIVYGKIRSRLSYKAIILIALALWAVAFISISQTSSAWLIAASVLVFGAGSGVVLPAVLVWVGETGPASFRGRVVSYLGTFGHLGQFSAPIIFGPVLLLLGLRGVFLSAGAVCTLLFLLFLFGMRR